MGKLLQLNLDNAFDFQELFNNELKKLNTQFIYFDENFQKLIKECRLFSSTKKFSTLINMIVNKLKEYSFKDFLITFYGSGDFHHITLALLELAANFTNKPFTVIHIDNHPDCVKDPLVSCGSWVNLALKKQYISKVITLGVCSNDLSFPAIKRINLQALQNEQLIILPFNIKPSFVFKKYHNCASFNYYKHKIIWKNISNLNSFDLVNLISNYINTENIYITIDKDAISIQEQITNWDQGNFSLSKIIELLKLLLAKYNIVGLDILGDYSSSELEGSLFARMYKKFEQLKDQPKVNKTITDISKINEMVNLKLLKVITELTI